MTKREEAEWQDLASRSQGGDAEAYTELLEDASVVLKQFLRARISDPSRVEDILQEVLLSLHLALPSYHPENSFSAWMYTIARRRMIDHLRKKHRKSVESSTEGEWFEGLVAEPEMKAFDNFLEIVNALPERKREAVRLVHIEGMAMAEVAEKLEITENNLRVTLHRAQIEIREKLEE